ncbi:teichoic acid glycerol-phosphate primase TarB [Staphylococcus argenteus]|uniref:teichoic acid glycerol-phosphate primase TarB n=1 Tax=Staphylococcus argenteus TaxID=985002 RepID=UPI000645AD1C|nr:teichoic acid glycerol-phosphate primase TarB [Staphylococcus argenteus]MBE2134668.1 CDP-glycerol glycerophosphotransferase family protein [Staphylococcus argenteus]MBE2146061.1 CDP-glycerol glycerophosphotransferase family protein [Staphylococcus argenteus]MBE2162605.1 CDP-glycerol glycerophosphotransferase family protein [Staphylococcus argenteus]MCG9797432.1 CDP-glycerol glycerophosphotransferase family protein [Staphylococcus argenteus]MCG9800095.1 CDP-glycerol glycerophosphotransferase
MNVLIKRLYHLLIRLLCKIISTQKSNKPHIVFMMTFPEDILPIIKSLNTSLYDVTVLTAPKNKFHLSAINNLNVVEMSNKTLVKQIKALKSAQLIIIDNYYLLLGGYKKAPHQRVIQTWHASGALKNFGLTDNQVDLSNKAMIQQYRQVYQATDFYLVGSPYMAHCFKQSLAARDDQMLYFGIPRINKYFTVDREAIKTQLKEQYGIKNKLALYVPTYREDSADNREINKTYFENELPGYTLLNKLHPSIEVSESDQLTSTDTSTLMLMADLIISDYSSLPIEASLLNIPTIFYVYDESTYDKVRGLNKYYFGIPENYKVYSEADLITAIKTNKHTLKPLFKDWHIYNTEHSLPQLLEYIDKMVTK